jgi:hypothetical protein
MNQEQVNKQKVSLIALVALMALLGLVYLLKRNPSPGAPSEGATPKSVASLTNQPVPAPPSASAPALPTPSVAATAPTNPAAQTFAWFQLHPFAVAQSNAIYGWTAEDGKDTNVIRRLAHNELEYARMVAENSTIHRRQLVYHPDGFTLLAQQAVQSGQSIQQLTLPGLDGQSLPVMVTKTDFESGGDRGVFYGKLPDDPNSMVTVAFINGREAFTVISSQANIYLQAEAREPGELVVKSIDPKTYGGQAD